MSAMLHKFSRPQAFLFGAASVLNLSGAHRQPSCLRRTLEQAIAGDFVRVNAHLTQAMKQQPVQPPEVFSANSNLLISPLEARVGTTGACGAY